MTASRHNKTSYGPKTDEMVVFGPFFVYDSGKEGECGQGKENQSQLARTATETERRDGKGREGMNEWEERKRKRGRRGLEKRETGIGKKEDGDWKKGSRGLEKREKKPDIVQLTV